MSPPHHLHMHLFLIAVASLFLSLSLFSHILPTLYQSSMNMFIHISLEHIPIPSLLHPIRLSLSLSAATPLFAAVWNFPSTAGAAVCDSVN